MEGMSRRVVTYDDIAPTDGSKSQSVKGNEKVDGGNASGSERKGKQPHWTADGRPISATAGRQYRRTLQLLGSGQIEEAETLLLRMDSAKLNSEIQQALAWAKRKNVPMATNGEMDDGEDKGDGDGVEEGEGSEDEEDEEEEEDDYDEGIEYQVGDTIDVQTLLNGAQQPVSKLTHAEIWDDSALIDAWDAAMEEYKMFDAQRTAHRRNAELAELQSTANHEGAKKRNRSDGDPNPADKPFKRSALWHDAPVVGSIQAQEARALAGEAARKTEVEQMELERRKREAKALLAQLHDDDDDDDNDAIIRGHEIPSHTIASTVQPKRRTPKGTKPPSSHILGNPAWHSACAVVSQTPNAIGDGKVNVAAQAVSRHGEAESHTGTASSEPHASPETGSGQGDDILQNLAMAWYYAGYYQAMASLHVNQANS